MAPMFILYTFIPPCAREERQASRSYSEHELVNPVDGVLGMTQDASKIERRANQKIIRDGCDKCFVTGANFRATGGVKVLKV